jgi:hypothetical protein
MPVQKLTSGNPRLCGEDGKDDKLAFSNCWLRALCGPWQGDGRLWLCISSQQAQKDAQTPTTISTPASLRCWADPARSILIQLRALALGWRGGGARKEGNQSSCWTAMEGGDSYRALVGGGQVQCPIGLPAVTSRSLPTQFMPSQRLKASLGALKLSLILRPRTVLRLSLLRAEVRNLTRCRFAAHQKRTETRFSTINLSLLCSVQPLHVAR